MTVMMKCGCAGQATCSSLGGQKFDPPIPACVVHDCIEVAQTPNLEGRKARCSCQKAIEPSSLDLAFFEYRGEGSRESIENCKCGYHWIAHQPRWVAKIKVSRRWFKIDPSVSVVSREFHAPADLAKQKAEIEANFFRNQIRDEETKVYNAEVLSLKEIKSGLKCKHFTAKGPQEFDGFYCGHSGWD